MYEDQTFEVVLKRLLSRVPDNVDKREGSVIYNSLAPAAMEIADIYAELDRHLTLRFTGTSGSTYLDLKVADQGIVRIQATYALRRGLFYDSTNALIDIPLNSRWSIADLMYTAVERVSIGHYVLKCGTRGEMGNKPYGTLLPIDYIAGLARAELSDVLSAGVEAETDESLQARFDLEVRKRPASGNKAHYAKLAREVAGIVDVRVQRAWNGPGTVKVVLLGDNKRAPSDSTVAAARARILEEIQLDSDGAITVVGVTEAMVSISAKLTLRAGGVLTEAVEQIRSTVSAYLAALAWTDTVVRYNKIGEALLDAVDVLDYADLRVNGGTANLELADDQVPVMGAVNMTLGV